ncbi:MAG TPA: TIM barrel protein [Anaerolineales bacterium]|nr:TIM barrel protein [Anaerolineales bacterium]
MKQEFSLAQLTVLHASPPELAKIAAETGYDFFSMRQIYLGLPEEPDFDLSKNKKLLAETKAVMAATGIRLLDIELARIVIEIDPSKYEPAFAIAAELGGKSVISSIWTEDTDLYLSRFAQVCDLAAQYGLRVELEYVPISAVKNLAGVVNVLNAVDRPNAGILVDIHHFHRAGDNPEDLARLPRRWFHMVHLCDAKAEIPTNPNEMMHILREDREYPGEGGIDIRSILAHIPQVPYSIELPKISFSDQHGYTEHARKCLDLSKKYLNICS